MHPRMPPNSNPSNLPSQPTHYEVLCLPKDFLADAKGSAAVLLKRAYHRALLRNHPDKAPTPQAEQQQPTKPGPPRQPQTASFTIDQISTAYATLADPQQRAAYDRALSLAQPAAAVAGGRTAFQTGIESVDLDDLVFDPALQLWHSSCRCGNERGYVLGEADLEDAADQGELIVGCQDCSLWLRVHFAVVEEDDEGEKDDDEIKGEPEDGT